MVWKTLITAGAALAPPPRASAPRLVAPSVGGATDGRVGSKVDASNRCAARAARSHFLRCGAKDAGVSTRWPQT